MLLRVPGEEHKILEIDVLDGSTEKEKAIYINEKDLHNLMDDCSVFFKGTHTPGRYKALLEVHRESLGIYSVIIHNISIFIATHGLFLYMLFNSGQAAHGNTPGSLL